MNTNHSDIPWLERDFFENQAKFPPGDLAKYAGLHIAWSLDGTHILASAPTMEEVDEKLRAAGINPARVVGDYVPPLDASFIG